MRRPCIEAGCNRLADNGRARCGHHEATLERGRYDRRQAIAPRRGPIQQLRYQINQAGGAICTRCLGWYHSSHIELDHIIELDQGGPHDLTNIQPLCRLCHHRKTAGEPSKF